MKKNKTPPVPFIRNYSRNYSYYNKIRRQKILRRILVVVGTIAVFLLGYFLMAMLLDISHMPPV
ncbi:MAG: hypothetical protein IJB86_03330 [Clostridia bacterium]|nr:hypothetical protein [Clostridia bacterium]